MSDVERLTIGDLSLAGVLEFGDGYRTKRTELSGSGFRIIRVADVSDAKVQLDSPDFVDATYKKAIGPKAGQAGDILLTTKGTVGRVAVLPAVPEDVVYSPQLCYFRVQATDILDPRYLRYWFTSPSFLRQAADRMNNTDMAAYINLTDIRSLQVEMPPLGEQKAIAEVLGALDDKIAANTKLAETSAHLAASVFLEAVGNGRVSSQLKLVAQNVPGKYLPKDEYVEDGEYFVYGSNSVMGKYDRALCAGNFTVLAKIGSYCGNLRWSQRPAWVNNNASAIVPLEGVNPWILRHALENLDMGPHRAGTGQPYIRMESLFSAEVDLPSPACSERISPSLENLAETEAVAIEENRTLAATRDALLPQLMSGKLRVKDIENTMGEMV